MLHDPYSLASISLDRPSALSCSLLLLSSSHETNCPKGKWKCRKCGELGFFLSFLHNKISEVTKISVTLVQTKGNWGDFTLRETESQQPNTPSPKTFSDHPGKAKQAD